MSVRAWQEQGYRDEIKDCPSLRTIKQLAEDMADLQGRLFRASCRRYVVPALACAVLLLVVALLSVYLPSPFARSPGVLAGTQAGVVLGYLLLVTTGRLAAGGVHESRAAMQVFDLVVKLEGPAARPPQPRRGHPQRTERVPWDATAYRWKIAADLGRVAASVERIPLASRGLADDVRAEAFRLGRAKADGLRDLQRWAITPTELTRTDLIARLASALQLLIGGRWYDLPEAELPPITARVRRRWFLIVTAAFATVTIVVLLAAFASTIGPAAPVLSTIAGVSLVGVLHQAGLSPTALMQYVEVSAPLREGDHKL